MPDTYNRRASSVHSVTNNLEGHLYIIRTGVDRGWSPEGHRSSIRGCQIRTQQLSIVVYGSPDTTEIILTNSQIYHKSWINESCGQRCGKLDPKLDPTTSHGRTSFYPQRTEH